MPPENNAVPTIKKIILLLEQRINIRLKSGFDKKE